MRPFLFDFNGTLSDDEPILCAIFQELFEEVGRPLDEQTYYERLLGLSDPEIVETWLGRADDDLVARKIALYRERVADGHTVDEETRAAIRLAAALGPVAVVSGSARDEIEPVLDAAGVLPLLSALVPIDDVARGKPEPDGYLRALELLRSRAAEAVAVEDSPPGLEAARRAGVRVAAVTRSYPPERLPGAELYAQSVDRDLIRRLGSPA